MVKLKSEHMEEHSHTYFVLRRVAEKVKLDTGISDPLGSETGSPEVLSFYDGVEQV